MELLAETEALPKCAHFRAEGTAQDVQVPLQVGSKIHVAELKEVLHASCVKLVQGALTTAILAGPDGLSDKSFLDSACYVVRVDPIGATARGPSPPLPTGLKLTSSEVLAFVEHTSQHAQEIIDRSDGDLAARSANDEFKSAGFAFELMMGCDGALRDLLREYHQRHDQLMWLAGRSPTAAECSMINVPFVMAAAPGLGKTRFVHELGRLGSDAVCVLLLDLGHSPADEQFMASVAEWLLLHVMYGWNMQMDKRFDQTQHWKGGLALPVLLQVTFHAASEDALTSMLAELIRFFNDPSVLERLTPKAVIIVVLRHMGRKSALLTVDETRAALNPSGVANATVQLQDAFSVPGECMLYTFATSVNILDPGVLSKESGHDHLLVKLAAVQEPEAQKIFFDAFPHLQRFGLYRRAVADSGGHLRMLAGIRDAALQYDSAAKDECHTMYEQITQSVKRALLSKKRTEGLSVPLIRAAFISEPLEAMQRLACPGCDKGESDCNGLPPTVAQLIANGYFDNSITNMPQIIPRISPLRSWIWAHHVVNEKYSKGLTESSPEQREELAVAQSLLEMMDEKKWAESSGLGLEAYVAHHHILMQRFLCNGSQTKWIPLRMYLRGALLSSHLEQCDIEIIQDMQVDQNSLYQLYKPDMVLRQGAVYIFNRQQPGFESFFLTRVKNRHNNEVRLVIICIEARLMAKEMRLDHTHTFCKYLQCLKIFGSEDTVAEDDENEGDGEEELEEGRPTLSDRVAKVAAALADILLAISQGKEAMLAAAVAFSKEKKIRIADLLAYIMDKCPDQSVQGRYESCANAVCKHFGLPEGIIPSPKGQAHHIHPRSNEVLAADDRPLKKMRC
eukprot:m51a1_g5905 hypothetical protein (849) ;mRNA; r:577141-580209